MDWSEGEEMSVKQGVAFIMTKKGFCYLTIKYVRRNFPIMHVRKYTIESEENRRREVCRSYRTKRRSAKRITCQTQKGSQNDAVMTFFDALIMFFPAFRRLKMTALIFSFWLLVQSPAPL